MRQTPKQNWERLKKIYEILGREFPDDQRAVLRGVRITIDLNLAGALECSICEDLIPISEIDIDSR